MVQNGNVTDQIVNKVTTGGSDSKTSEELSMGEVLEKFGKAYRIINESYVEEPDDSKLLEGAIQGMLQTLDDPYSVYMDQQQNSL
ncbi:hypothetical protein KHA80_13465 [Anaerobacillus sp. HL2]|nr:hypothetical protein KHA80_13465 [Anaerobacillus sp. HL2]